MTLPTYGPRAYGTGCSVIDPNPDGTRGTRPCGQPAAWHIAWEAHPDATHTSFVCDDHMGSLKASVVYTDRHPVGEDCKRAGARWSDSSVGAWCVAPEGAPELDEVAPTPAARAVEAMQRLESTLLFTLHPDLQGPDDKPTT